MIWQISKNRKMERLLKFNNTNGCAGWLFIVQRLLHAQRQEQLERCGQAVLRHGLHQGSCGSRDTAAGSTTVSTVPRYSFELKLSSYDRERYRYKRR